MPAKPKSPKETDTNNRASRGCLESTCSRLYLYQCSACGKITQERRCYGSFALEEGHQNEQAYACSDACEDAITAKMTYGEWSLPKLRMVLGGAAYDISRPRKGYERQPTQEDLIDMLIDSANVERVDPPTSTSGTP